MTKLNTSQRLSFKGWDVWKFISGRKKTAVTIVAVGLGYIILDNEAAAVAAGGIVEAVWAITEYYYKKVEY